MRRALLAVAPVAALVAIATAMFAAAVALPELALVPVAILVTILVAILALEAAAAVLAPIASRRSLLAVLAKVLARIPARIPAMTAAVTMPLAALLAVSTCLARGRSGLRPLLRTRLVMTVAMPLMARLAILVAAAGTPDLDELRLAGRFGRSRLGGDSIRGRSGSF